MKTQTQIAAEIKRTNVQGNVLLIISLILLILAFTPLMSGLIAGLLCLVALWTGVCFKAVAENPDNFQPKKSLYNF